jgi:AcrR family transcriptional regulator
VEKGAAGLSETEDEGLGWADGTGSLGAFGSGRGMRSEREGKGVGPEPETRTEGDPGGSLEGLRASEEVEPGTRERLLDAGAALFSERGYAATTIRDISSGAGCNSSLVSYHFGGKEGLYEAVLSREYAALTDRIPELRDPGLAPESRVVRFCRLIVETHRRRPTLLRLVLSELMTPSPVGERVMGAYVPRIVSFLLEAMEEGQRSGAFRADMDPRQAALSLAGMLNFYFIVRPLIPRILAEVGSDWDESYAMGAVQLFFEGVSARGGEEGA